MKHQRFAFGLLGLMTACGAYAQSSVTIYGVLDLAAAKTNNGTSFLTGLPAGLFGAQGVWNLRPSTSSRIGFRGTEDLGSGWRANFSIEHRIDPSTGTEQFGQNGFWRGHSWIGLSNASFGEVRIGRQQNAALFVAQRGDPWNWDYNVGTVQVINRAGNGATYTANLVSYTTPRLFNGLTLKGEVGAGEGGTNALGNSNRTVGANAMYSNGPLFVGVGYNDVKTVNTPARNRYWVVTTTYTIGAFQPMLQYTEAKNNSPLTSRSFTVGTRVNVGGGQLKAVAARYDPAGANNTITKVGLGYEYFLSKRTSVHADVGSGKTERLSRTNGFEFGMKHVF